MADWGALNNTNTTDEERNALWLSGALFPEAGTLDSVSVMVGPFDEPNADYRVAVYQGGSAGSPEGATKIWDSGQQQPSSIDEWQTHAAGGEALAADYTWIAVIVDSACDVWVTGNADRGDLDQRLMRHTSHNDPTTAAPDPFPSGASTFNTSEVVKAYLTYSTAASVGDGTLAAQDAQVAGSGQREITGSGALGSQAAASAGTGERTVTGTGALLAQASVVAGTGTLQLKLLLTAAENRELVDESGSAVANLSNIAYEWYDTIDDTDGNPDQEGTFDTDANGEATIQLTSTSLESGQFGTLILYHPTDNAIRGVYRVPVT